MHLRPDVMQGVFEAHEQAPEGDPICLQESALGTNEYVAGEWLGMRWHLPEPVVFVIGHLGMMDSGGEYARLVGLVRAARRWVDATLSGQPAVLSHEALDEETGIRIGEAFRTRFEELKDLADLMA